MQNDQPFSNSAVAPTDDLRCDEELYPVYEPRVHKAGRHLRPANVLPVREAQVPAQLDILVVRPQEQLPCEQVELRDEGSRRRRGERRRRDRHSSSAALSSTASNRVLKRSAQCRFSPTVRRRTEQLRRLASEISAINGVRDLSPDVSGRELALQSSEVGVHAPQSLSPPSPDVEGTTKRGNGRARFSA